MTVTDDMIRSAINAHGGSQGDCEWEWMRDALLAALSTPAAKREEGELGCTDCGRRYSKGPDLVISDVAWEKIAPDMAEHGGVLCPNCIHDRLVRAGYQYGEAPGVFTSGPLSTIGARKPSIPAKPEDGHDLIGILKVAMINAWRFDEGQQHTHTWHDRTDFIYDKMPALVQEFFSRLSTEKPEA